ncbi:hypothetical protein [Ammoniphilus oxalaticus]|nr:hypothetical protein [Ammoniphilus oxalaticus]
MNDELFIQIIFVLADSLQELIAILRLAQRDQIIIHFVDEQLTNQTIQKTLLLENAAFFADLQSKFLSHSSTFRCKLRNIKVNRFVVHEKQITIYSAPLKCMTVKITRCMT